jgi:REP element-mobilizing transposase RayT
MSNHVHAVFRLFDKNEVEKPKYLEDIMHSIKRFSAYEINKILNRSGHFWQVESYDRWVRNDEEQHRIIEYVLNNPVKAKLCQKPLDWKWTFLNERFKKIFQ